MSIVEGSSGLCSRSGSETFSPTLIEPNSAPPWNDIPIIFRRSSSSRSEIVARFLPAIHTSPLATRSRPTSVRNKVLFPDPEPPRITSVSPGCTSKLIP